MERLKKMFELEEVTKKEYCRFVEQLACDFFNFGEKSKGVGLLQKLEVFDSLEKLGYCVHYFFDYACESYEVIVSKEKCFFVDGDGYG
jgi:hypothetical protein